MNIHMNTQQSLRIYEQYIANLSDYDSSEELELDVFLVLTTRDFFVDRPLTNSEQQLLDHLDSRLCRHRDVIAQFLPGPNPPPHPHWWWYLHEGAPLREEMLQPA